MAKFKNPRARKPTFSDPMLSAADTNTSSMAYTTVATTAPSSDKICKRWGPPCPFSAQSAPHPSPVDSDWSEED